MNREVFLSLLAMDAYNRGNSPLINVEGDDIGVTSRFVRQTTN